MSVWKNKAHLKLSDNRRTMTPFLLVLNNHGGKKQNTSKTDLSNTENTYKGPRDRKISIIYDITTSSNLQYRPFMISFKYSWCALCSSQLHSSVYYIYTKQKKIHHCHSKHHNMCHILYKFYWRKYLIKCDPFINFTSFTCIIIYSFFLCPMRLLYTIIR